MDKKVILIDLFIIILFHSPYATHYASFDFKANYWPFRTRFEGHQMISDQVQVEGDRLKKAMPVDPVSKSLYILLSFETIYLENSSIISYENCHDIC